MSYPSVNIPVETSLEWLLDNNLIEECDISCGHQYRVAVNPATSRTYSITEIVRRYTKRFGKGQRGTKHTSTRRELYKCLDEYSIYYMSQYEKACEYWLFEDTHQKFLEQKLNIDMTAMNEYDSREGKTGRKWTAYWKRVLKKYGEEKALGFFKNYFDKRMKDLSADLRHGKPRSLIGKRFFRRKQPLEAVKATNP